MDEDDNLDVNAWLGKPPELAVSKSGSRADDVDDGQSVAATPSPTSSSHESDIIEILPHSAPPQAHTPEDEEEESEDGVDEVQEVVDESQEDNGIAMTEAEAKVDDFVVNRQENFTIKVPQLAEDERADFDYLSDHFTAKRILYAMPDRQYLVKLGSGEVDLVRDILRPLEPLHFSSFD